MKKEALYKHIHKITKEIGSRPAGHENEAKTRKYISESLASCDMQAEFQYFKSWDTWGYTVIWSISLSLLGSLIAYFGNNLTTLSLGSLLSILGGLNLFKSSNFSKQPLSFLFKKRKTANLIFKNIASSSVKDKIVLVGHTDTNKHRNSSETKMKPYLKLIGTLTIILPIILGVIALYCFFFTETNALITVFWILFLILTVILITAILDEKNGFVEGANDNATALASLIEITKYFSKNQLKNTELWSVFSAAEEVGCLGIHQLLDKYGEELKDALFIVFEMTGSPHIAYVTEGSGFSYLSPYKSDEKSLNLAKKVASDNPELKIKEKKIDFGGETATLIGRGYRALCITGNEENGWISNWHNYNDTIDNIDINGVKKGAQFAVKIIEYIDK